MEGTETVTYEMRPRKSGSHLTPRRGSGIRTVGPPVSY
jgi:hypothetical protein